MRRVFFLSTLVRVKSKCVFRALPARHLFALGACRKTPCVKPHASCCEVPFLERSFVAAPMQPTPTQILLVDDDPAMLRLLAKWLESDGYEVLRASDSRAAQELLEAQRPSILLTGWELPQQGGPELVRWARAQNFGHYIYTI